MKTIITIALLTSTSLLTDNYAAALDDGTLSACGGAGRTTASVTPSTLGDLEIFLRTKCGTVFPEIGFSEFSTPFKPGFAKLKRISQMRAQTAAINTIGQMVALGYYSFTREIESLKVRTPHFTDRIVSRSEAMTHYHRHNHSYFLTFQAMIMQVLEWAQTRTGDLANDAKAALTQSHGSSTALKIAWLQDNTGIVPVPFQGALTRTIYSSATPYGNWGDDYQRSMVFVDGQLIAAPGIHIETKDGITFKFIRENGLRNGFITSPLTMRASPDHPLVSTLLGMGAFRIGASRSDGLDALLALPETALENKEFEAAFLEELMEEETLGESVSCGRNFLESHIRAIENISEEVVLTHEAESSAESADTARDDSALSTRPLQAYIDSLYEEQILAEQAEISRRVAEGSTAGRIRAPKKRGAKHATKTATARVTTSTVVTDSSSEEKAALRREILSRLKERGRTKWRTLARALIAALRNAYSDNAIVIRVTEKGSHFMLHIEGEASSDGVTIIRPHGRADRTLSAGEARGLADNLIDLTFRLMARS